MQFFLIPSFCQLSYRDILPSEFKREGRIFGKGEVKIVCYLRSKDDSKIGYTVVFTSAFGCWL